MRGFYGAERAGGWWETSYESEGEREGVVEVSENGEGNGIGKVGVRDRCSPIAIWS